jgi:hypothetical protein
MMSAVLGKRQLARLGKLGPSVMGERLGGFIYGTIVVLSVLVAGSRAYPDDAGRIAVLVVVTSTVFWLAHVYAHGVADSIGREEHISLPDLRRMARREGAIVEATLPPVVALLLTTGLSQVIALERSLGVTTGHDVTIEFVERTIAELEASPER